MKETFNSAEACKAQSALWDEKDYPHFAPSSGICYSCNQDIYSPKTQIQGDRQWTTGISVESASKSLVTGCPHCHRSYCD